MSRRHRRKSHEHRNLGDVRWCATEDGSQGKGTGRHIACFVLLRRTTRAGAKFLFELPKTAWSINIHLSKVWWLDTEFPSTIFWRPLNYNGTILWSDLQDPDSFEP